MKKHTIVTSLALLGLFVAACRKRLPPANHNPIPPQTKVDLFLPPDTLGMITSESTPSMVSEYEAQQKQHPGLVPLYPMPHPSNSFSARIYTLKAAKKTLDMQYYIWSNDVVGQMLFLEVLKAAQRGIKVRLLLDDFGSRGMDNLILGLSQHPNIEIRLYNPSYWRKLWVLSYLGHFQLMQHRMHNKNFIVDNTFLVVGGRNIANSYFQNVDQHTVFADMDILTAGKPALQAHNSFTTFWDSPEAYPIQQVAHFSQHAVDKAMQQLYNAPKRLQFKAYWAELVIDNLLEVILSGSKKIFWGLADYISDVPTKTIQKERIDQSIPAQVQSKMAGAQQYLNLAAAYFVYSKKQTKQLAELAAKGVKVRVLTNSLSSTDAIGVYSFYAPMRNTLLKGGVELHEYRHDQYLPDENTRSHNWFFKRQNHGSMHSKVYQWDGSNVFVGSFNMDPRSLIQNTEDGLIMECLEIGDYINNSLTKNLSQTSYRVIPKSTQSNKQSWVQYHHNGKQTLYKIDPNTSMLERAVAKFIGLFPIIKQYV